MQVHQKLRIFIRTTEYGQRSGSLGGLTRHHIRSGLSSSEFVGPCSVDLVFYFCNLDRILSFFPMKLDVLACSGCGAIKGIVHSINTLLVLSTLMNRCGEVRQWSRVR